VRKVVADTGPLHYLILVEEIGLIPRLFDTVLAPEAVRAELDHLETPIEVRHWIANPPPWFLVHSVAGGVTRKTLRAAALDEGEAEALALAATLRADLILMDDRAGVAAARTAGFAVMGTLGVLDLAARRGMTDLAASLVRLRATNFRCRQAVMDELLARYEADRGVP